MTLTSVQQQLVEENMGLVRLVLSRCVNGRNSVGIYSYDDLFQIGCIGLCKAAVEYKPGKAAFSTYAFTLIRNEIYHALERATLRRNREILSDDVREPIPGADAPELTAAELRTALMAAKSRLNGVARKGVDAIALMSEGKTCKEIGMIYGTTANNVSAWISKARKALKADPEFIIYVSKLQNAALARAERPWFCKHSLQNDTKLQFGFIAFTALLSMQ